jgi:glycosyltransferase involved in cell wall biosynthesis
MPAEPLVSFVLPCYNYGRYLPDCLASIFGQTGSGVDFEVVAIDDGSTDDTRALLTACRDQRLRVLYHSVNQGHRLTVSEGLAEARGRFVARIDPDDRLRPNFLAVLLPLFERSPRVGLVHGDAAMINERGEVTCPRCDDGVHGGQPFCGSALLAILERNYLCAPTALARREAWQKHLPVWEGLAFNDWYFNVMIARDYDFAYVPEVVADYRVHGSNHHARVVRDRSEEPSLMRVLDYVFAHAEADAVLEAHKQRARARIYAAHYLDQAEKYFGAGLLADARRCYREVLWRQPGRLLRPGPLRRWLASYLGRQRYEALTRLLGRPAGTPP